MRIRELLARLKMNYPGRYISITCEFEAHRKDDAPQVKWQLYVSGGIHGNLGLPPAINEEFESFQALESFAKGKLGGLQFKTSSDDARLVERAEGTLQDEGDVPGT